MVHFICKLKKSLQMYHSITFGHTLQTIRICAFHQYTTKLRFVFIRPLLLLFYICCCWKDLWHDWTLSSSGNNHRIPYTFSIEYWMDQCLEGRRYSSAWIFVLSGFSFNDLQIFPSLHSSFLSKFLLTYIMAFSSCLIMLMGKLMGLAPSERFISNQRNSDSLFYYEFSELLDF